MELSFIVPAYNEEGNLSFVLEGILRLGEKMCWNYEVIVVNDNSSDATSEIANSYAEKYGSVSVIHRGNGHKGMGSALKEGTKKTRGDIIIWMMADMSDDPKTISGMVEKLNNGYDIVIASRYMKGGSTGDLNIVRATLSRLYSWTSKVILGLPVYDITNSFRGFKKSIFEKINLESEDFAIASEFTIKTYMQEFKLGEVPTTYMARKRGKSKFNVIKMVFKNIMLFKYRLRKRPNDS